MRTIVMYTDGGARNNPGPAGAGVVIKDEGGRTLKEIARYLGEQTNNWAEYEAVAIGLSELKKIIPKNARKDTRVEVRLDSELVTKQLRSEYQLKEATLFPQFIKIHNMRIAEFPNIMFTHIPREKNKEADALANRAMDEGTSTLL